MMMLKEGGDGGKDSFHNIIVFKELKRLRRSYIEPL